MPIFHTFAVNVRSDVFLAFSDIDRRNGNFNRSEYSQTNAMKRGSVPDLKPAMEIVFMIMAIQLLGYKRKARARIEKELWIMKYCTIAYAGIIEASWLAYDEKSK